MKGYHFFMFIKIFMHASGQVEGGDKYLFKRVLEISKIVKKKLTSWTRF